MPTIAAPPATCIYEDKYTSPSKASKPKGHKRIPSVGDVLRGRRKENEAPKSQLQPGQSPLGERHINSPPQAKRVPLKGEESRPTMHKKTQSSSSFRSLIGGKDRQTDARSVTSLEEKNENHKPKKSKSSTNLGALLKKKSKKSLKEESHEQENVAPPTSAGIAPTPIWAQYATQPLEDQQGRLHYPQAGCKNIEEEIALYTPRDYSEFRPSQQRNFHDSHVPMIGKPPQRPFLEHKTSRSSIFTEELEENQPPALIRPKSRDQSRSRPV